MELLVTATSADGQRVAELEPIPIRLSSASEASARCMVPLVSVKELRLRAVLVERPGTEEEDEGEDHGDAAADLAADGAGAGIGDVNGGQTGGRSRGHLCCDSGEISLRDEGWICIGEDGVAGEVSRLLTYAYDGPGGWTLFFDVKERSDSVCLLRYVRVVRSKAPTPAPCAGGKQAGGAEGAEDVPAAASGDRLAPSPSSCSSSPPPPAAPAAPPASVGGREAGDDGGERKPAGAPPRPPVFDCDGDDGDGLGTDRAAGGGEGGLHPAHAALLRTFRRPSLQLLDPGNWRAMGRRGLTATEDFRPVPGLLSSPSSPSSSSASSPSFARSAASALAELRSAGHGRLGELPWGGGGGGVEGGGGAVGPAAGEVQRGGVSMEALSETMDSLRRSGFPPAFIFMYDQAWSLLLQLFDVGAALLAPAAAEAAGADAGDLVEMSLSAFAWALEDDCSDSDAAAAEGVVERPRRVGANFGKAHRDQSYRACHSPEGELGMLTTWVAITPVNLDNGCMFVVPAQSDVLLEQPDEPAHETPTESYSRPLGIPVAPCDAGDVLFWRADLIHWGGACAPRCPRPPGPRKSLATMFVRPGFGKGNTMTRAEVLDGVPLDVRLRIVSRTLLQYKSWYPDFAGVSFEECAAMRAAE